MKKRLQGINLFLMLMLIFAFACASIVSAAGTTAGGLVPDPTVEDDPNNTVSIQKELIFINDAASTVREPNITYTYTISAVTMPTDNPYLVTDDENTTVPVKSGVADAITGTTAEITFVSTNTSNTSITGVTQTRYADFTFDPTEFPEPGIYRYKVVESSTSKAAVGIEEVATYNTDRYLDVYVRKAAENSDTLVIYGYVLFENTDGNVSFNAYADPTVNLEKKSSGYVNTEDTDDGQYANVDVYRTQDLTVTKTTTGLMADKSNDFPVTFTFDGPEPITADIPVDVEIAGNGALDDIASADDYLTFAAGDGTFTGTVRNGSSIKFIGVPEGTEFTFVEQNNTPDSYRVSATALVGSDDPDDATSVLDEAVIAAGQSTSSSDAVAMSSFATVDITNTLDAISPTGFITRFAPYVLLLVGGILLIVLGRKAVNNTKKKNA